MGVKTVIPFGPQHPVLPEPVHLDLVVEDEVVQQAIPQIGFVHRGLEKLVETRDYVQYVYVAERVCGICSVGHSIGYAQAVESLMGLEVPERAEYLRAILFELSRVHSHLLWLGLGADALGFESLFMHCWRLRERVLDMFEKMTGGRVILSAVGVGGMTRDIDDDALKELLEVLDGVKGEYGQVVDTFLGDSSVASRLEGVGVISEERARELCMVGPFARASGVAEDLRCLRQGCFRHLEEFEPVVAIEGDCLARARVRAAEVAQSIGIIRQMVGRIPPGSVMNKPKGPLEAGARACVRVEQPRGECVYVVKGNGTKYLDRVRIRTPTSQNIAGMCEALQGCDLADVPNIILTIDPCISCTER